MTVRKSVGAVSVEAETDGWPIWVNVSITAINGETVKARVGAETLHDIRYCVDRVLAHLEQNK